ncbi:ASCH domain-containing protein [Streptomyces sp. NPDC005727]|uniref:ASCH domain-containing protein n=1 Tax=Streptomyces sp. NPDC005727 TaxID=3157053 RepID=UPI0033D83A25
MTEPAAARVRELNLYRRYFDLVAAGQKTIEARVQYRGFRDVRPRHNGVLST